MSDIMGVDIGNIMDSWVKKACAYLGQDFGLRGLTIVSLGHPVLNVQQTGSTIEITQQLATNTGTFGKLCDELRNFSLPVIHLPTNTSNAPQDGDELIYPVPIIAKTISSTGELFGEQRFIMTKSKETLFVSPNPSSITLLNANHTGFYRYENTDHTSGEGFN